MDYNNFSCIFVKEEYFIENNDFVEMLDNNDLKKQTQRKYIYLNFKYKDNTLLVPLRTEMPNIRKLGQVGYSVPSTEKPNAGLDFRKILIINDSNYLEIPEYCKVPPSQANIINVKYETIKKQVESYVDGYIKSVKKNRHEKDKKYKFSTLHNYHLELGIISEIQKEAAPTLD
ncbi:hypothetical protein [Clostridium perfringens]|uniref:hypothetical protein n=1 Tax=Clostridium perfringens TaxID=1502 RepID=UPI001C84AF26|nr:hypothetical protein [Clostridium perfringens]